MKDCIVYEICIDEWNELKKPSIVDVVANERDICIKVLDVYFLLQDPWGTANVVVYRPGKSDINIVPIMLYAIWTFYDVYEVSYMRIKGRKYKFLYKLFNRGKGVVNQEDTYYINVSDPEGQKLLKYYLKESI